MRDGAAASKCGVHVGVVGEGVGFRASAAEHIDVENHGIYLEIFQTTEYIHFKRTKAATYIVDSHALRENIRTYCSVLGILIIRH